MMSSEKPPPKRAVEVAIHIHGDTMDDVLVHLQELVEHCTRTKQVSMQVMGGPTAGYTVNVELRPEQTHEKWRRELDEYLATEAS